MPASTCAPCRPAPAALSSDTRRACPAARPRPSAIAAGGHGPARRWATATARGLAAQRASGRPRADSASSAAVSAGRQSGQRIVCPRGPCRHGSSRGRRAGPVAVSPHRVGGVGVAVQRGARQSPASANQNAPAPRPGIVEVLGRSFSMAVIAHLPGVEPALVAAALHSRDASIALPAATTASARSTARTSRRSMAQASKGEQAAQPGRAPRVPHGPASKPAGRAWPLPAARRAPTTRAASPAERAPGEELARWCVRGQGALARRCRCRPMRLAPAGRSACLPAISRLAPHPHDRVPGGGRLAQGHVDQSAPAAARRRTPTARRPATANPTSTAAHPSSMPRCAGMPAANARA